MCYLKKFFSNTSWQLSNCATSIIGSFPAEARCVLTSDISSKIPVQTFTPCPADAPSGASVGERMTADKGRSEGESEREGARGRERETES